MAEYTIRLLSQLFQLPASTLRYYEEIGLLTNVERTESGKRIYRERHVNQLKTICCFKHAGMTMSQLQEFFVYENDEAAHIDDILKLLDRQEDSILVQMEHLQLAYVHLQRKLRYYGDIKISLDEQKPLPKWSDYRERNAPKSEVVLNRRIL